MLSLTHLPYETLVEIHSFLRYTDLAALTRVSSHQHDVSLPLPLVYMTPYLTETPTSERARPFVEIILFTLLTPGRESLASQVRSIIIGNPARSHGAVLMVILDFLSHLEARHLSPPNSRSTFTRFLESSMAAEKLAHGLYPYARFIAHPAPTVF